MMEADKLDGINREIYTKFPYLKDAPPKIKTLSDGHSVLVYSASVETESKFTLPITVKVKVNPAGHVLSITTSK